MTAPRAKRARSSTSAPAISQHSPPEKDFKQGFFEADFHNNYDTDEKETKMHIGLLYIQLLSAVQLLMIIGAR